MHKISQHFCFSEETPVWALDNPESHNRVVLHTLDAYCSPLKSVQVFAPNSVGQWLRLWGSSIHKQLQSLKVHCGWIKAF